MKTIIITLFTLVSSLCFSQTAIPTLDEVALSGDTAFRSLSIEGSRSTLKVTNGSSRSSLGAGVLTLLDVTGSSLSIQGGTIAIGNGEAVSQIKSLSTETRVWLLPDFTTTFIGISEVNTTAPTSETDTGKKGEVRYDLNFRYECIKDNLWIRTRLIPWCH